jgi:opacity protein-like surface antigen
MAPSDQRNGFNHQTALEGGHMRTLFLTAALLSTVTLPAAATDMPMKAPRPTPEAIISDWSGFYVGVGAGYGWGREKFDNPKTSIANLFDTSVVSVLGGNPVLVQPGFTIPGDLSRSFKERGFVAGGFFGAQKQFGNWVLGVEADIYATGMKMSFSGNSSKLEDVIRFEPNTLVTTPQQTLHTNPQDVPFNFTVGSQGLQLVTTASGFPPNSTLQIGTEIAVRLNSGGNLQDSTPVILKTTQPVTVDANGNAQFSTGSGGNVTLNNGGNSNTFIGTLPGSGTGTVHIPPLDVVVPPQTLSLPIPHETTVEATVSRSISMDSRIEELGSVRGKIGLAASPNWMIYGTGGPAWAHVTRTLNISQTVAFTPSEGPRETRTNTFSASTGETRLGFAVGAGIDWKLSPNLVLGALYLHYEFPKGTVTFADGSNSVGFGTSRQSADAITGRLSWMVPIH